MMLALCPAVTFRRPFALAYSNANRAILRLAVSLIALIDRPESCRTRLPVVRSMKAISSAVCGAPCSSSIPVYEPSVSSRTTTTSAVSYGDRTPGYSVHGRTAAYRPKAPRSPTFTLRNPAGVASGPFSATPVAPDRLDHPGRKRRPLGLDDREPGRLEVPFDLDAGGLDRHAGGVDELGSGPVAGDQRDPVHRHGGIVMG